MKVPRGFRAHGLAAGIKPSGKSDLALIAADAPLAWAFAGTQNRLVAPCVTRNRMRFGTGEPMQALIVNAGNANCANGDRGAWDNEEMASLTSHALDLPRPQDVLTASTGVIGEPLPVERIREHLPNLATQLGEDTAAFAESVLTTDLRSKRVAATLRSGARIVGIAKGSGMIHPDMATMLAFVMTDADVSQAALRELWPGVVRRTFNQVTVDGDTSPNDMGILLASGRAEAGVQEFTEALEAVCRKLAEKIAADGEGATTLLHVTVEGAKTEEEALVAARSVAGSALVKSAVHGRDPNWGRILSSLGASGALWDQSRMAISLQGTPVYRGAPLDFDRPALAAALDAARVTVHADLAAGEARGQAWGCDLSEDYVRINAEYTT